MKSSSHFPLNFARSLARHDPSSAAYRLGIMTPSLKIAASPLAFFDELRVFGFVEGQNLKVDGGGYGLRDEQLPVHPPGANRRRHLQEGPRMKKTFAAFVAAPAITDQVTDVTVNRPRVPTPIGELSY